MRQHEVVCVPQHDAPPGGSPGGASQERQDDEELLLAGVELLEEVEPEDPPLAGVEDELEELSLEDELEPAELELLEEEPEELDEPPLPSERESVR